MKTRGVFDRLCAVTVMILLAGAALWLFDDGSGPVSWLVKTVKTAVVTEEPPSAPSVTDAEGFVGTEVTKEMKKGCASLGDVSGNAGGYGADASPAVFEEGRRTNPPAPPSTHCVDPPDPQMMSLLLEYRNREGLFLACRPTEPGLCGKKKRGKKGAGGKKAGAVDCCIVDRFATGTT